MLNRRQFLGGVGSALTAAAASKPLNFVFILIDDLGWTDFACYGSKYHQTPNIDRLAGQGVRFTNAYSGAPLCSATRASIMTGKSPTRLHMTCALPGIPRPRPTQKYVSPALPPGLPLEEITIAEALKRAGYRSACMGKWHLGSSESLFPERQGFDVNIGRTGAGMTRSFFYPQWAERGIHVTGKEGDYLTDRLTDEALGFMEAQKDNPFFLYLSHFAVHTFIQGKPDKVEKYRSRLDPKLPHKHPVYAAMMESVDESVGRVLGKLEELQIAERTVVILASDNGGEVVVQRFTGDPLPPTSNLPLREGKNTLYEGGVRVPLIIRGPGVRQGAVCDEPVISADFFPTIVEMAGGKAGPLPKDLDGQSLVPLLRGGGHLKRDALYWYFPHYDPRPVAAIRQGSDKLLEFLDDGHLELYNLAEDIGESNNLAASNSRKASALQHRLHKWMTSVNASPMTPNPAYAGAVTRTSW